MNSEEMNKILEHVRKMEDTVNKLNESIANYKIIIEEQRETIRILNEEKESKGQSTQTYGKEKNELRHHSTGRLGSNEALNGFAIRLEMPPDGNCFFHSIASEINDDPMLHQILRDIAANVLVDIDNTWTEGEKERIIGMIGAGVLVDGMPEFEQRYGGSISNYAHNYTAQDGNSVGGPEAVALAEYLQRPIAIITPPSNAEIQRQLTMGNPAPPDMVFVYLPDCTIRQHQIPTGTYEQLWMLEREPIVLIHNGGNHFDAVQWFGLDLDVDANDAV